MSSTLRWFKSSYSSDSGGDCVEVAVDWHKSSYSDSSGGECIEVATCPEAIHVRDSKNTQGPQLTVPPAAWRSFVTYAADGTQAG